MHFDVKLLLVVRKQHVVIVVTIERRASANRASPDFLQECQSHRSCITTFVKKARRLR